MFQMETAKPGRGLVVSNSGSEEPGEGHSHLGRGDKLED